MDQRPHHKRRHRLQRHIRRDPVEKIRIGVAHRVRALPRCSRPSTAAICASRASRPSSSPAPATRARCEALLAGEVDFINSVGAELILAEPAAPRRRRRHRLGDQPQRPAGFGAARASTTREELRGKRWGVITRNDADECAILMAFERWGWDIATRRQDRRRRLAGPAPRPLLDEKRVDVAIMHAPEPFQAAKRGWNLVEDLGRLDVAFQNSCAATTRRLIAERGRRRSSTTCAPTPRRSTASAPIQPSASPCCASTRARPDPARSSADLGAVRPPDGRHDVPEPRGHALGASVLHRLGVVPQPLAPEAVRRPRAGRDAGGGGLLRPLHGPGKSRRISP